MEGNHRGSLLRGFLEPQRNKEKQTKHAWHCTCTYQLTPATPDPPRGGGRGFFAPLICKSFAMIGTLLNRTLLSLARPRRGTGGQGSGPRGGQAAVVAPHSQQRFPAERRKSASGKQPSGPPQETVDTQGTRRGEGSEVRSFKMQFLHPIPLVQSFVRRVLSPKPVILAIFTIKKNVKEKEKMLQLPKSIDKKQQCFQSGGEIISNA